MSMSTISPSTSPVLLRSSMAAPRHFHKDCTPHSTVSSSCGTITHWRTDVHSLSGIKAPRRPYTVLRAAEADEVVGAVRALAGPILTVAGSLAAASGAAAVVLYRIGTIDKSITDNVNSLKEQIDKQGKELEAKIDRQESTLTGIAGEVRSLATDVANIKGRLTPWYPPVASGPPPTSPPVPTGAPDKTTAGAKDRLST